MDEWVAQVERLKAKAYGTRAEAQLELKQKIEALEGKIKQGKAKLAEIVDASDDSWESIKERVDSSWDLLKSSICDTEKELKK